MGAKKFYEMKGKILKIAEEYCREHGLSVEKLHQQVFGYSEIRSVFAQRQTADVNNGIKEDLSTLPIPTLIISKTKDGYTVEETDATKEYLVEKETA